jgi:hypothetical protein
VDPQEDRHWHKLAVPLSWLCSLDDHPSPNALGDALGDSYLCRHNPIFARVRDAALGFGYQFSAADTPLWRDYQALPLMTLHRILEGRTIPYLNTALTVKRLLENNPKVALAPGFLLSVLKPNHAFHESAHCVAHSVMRSFEADLRRVSPCEKERFVLTALFAESFANTVERLAAINTTTGVSDPLFYNLNSYIHADAKLISALNPIGTEVASRTRFALLFFALFEANLTGGGPDECTWRRIADASRYADDQGEVVRSIAHAGFALSSAFRLDTNPAFFDLLGYNREFRELRQTRWLGRPDHQELGNNLAMTLFEIAERKDA